MSPVVVPLRAVGHHQYCSRLAVLIHVDGVWRDSAHTLRGLRGHQRVDTHPSRFERGRRVIRGLELWSERYGLAGRADVVEVLDDGTVEPVEYKHGSKHGRSAEVQLCAQALCLEEMLGVDIRHGHVWYAGPRRRERVAIDASLRELTVRSIEAIHRSFTDRTLPPAPNDARCGECQLHGYCLPSIVTDPDRVERYIDEAVLSCE